MKSALYADSGQPLQSFTKGADWDEASLIQSDHMKAMNHLINVLHTIENVMNVNIHENSYCIRYMEPDRDRFCILHRNSRVSNFKISALSSDEKRGT